MNELDELFNRDPFTRRLTDAEADRMILLIRQQMTQFHTTGKSPAVGGKKKKGDLTAPAAKPDNSQMSLEDLGLG